MSKMIRIGLIGQRFMGRAHSNAWSQANKFFDLPATIELATIAARDATELAQFAMKWGWLNHTTDWRSIAKDGLIDLVDIGTPNDVHAEQSIAMLEAGKHVACEKPLAGTLADARAMRDAAKKAKGKKTFVWFNYRRCPAVALAHRLVAEGKVGKVYHVRATYLQSWGFEDTPLLWRFQKKIAGSGAHGDLNAHIIDMARFVTGDEIVEINGAIAKTFFTERPLLSDPKKKGKADVDDTVLFLATFKGGAVASFEATRIAHGHQNRNTLEINGSKGSLRFDFEDMNLLWYLDATADPRTRGWTRIMCTDASHPYAKNWWPAAHVIGYEHGFVNMAADIGRVLCGGKPEVALPDFADAYETQRVLEAAMLAAKHRSNVKLSEVK